MNAGNWIELAALLVTILGGGGIGVSKVTRVAVALEQVGKALVTLGESVTGTAATVQAHDTQLAVHETRLTALEGQQQARTP